jgi:hypothetical protein
MQGRQDYYLQHRVSASGKAETLKPLIASVQNAAETLFLASTNAGQDSAAIEVASTIVIPATAQVWIGTASSPLSLSAGQSVSLIPGSTIFLQISNPGQTDGLVTGIRFLLSTDMGGNPVGYALVNDGSQYNALRITSIHSTGPPTTGETVIAFWTRTAYCSDTTTNFNLFRNSLISAPVVNSFSISTGTVSLSVPGLNSTMSIAANATTQSTTSLSGSDLDTAFTLPVLTINGAEYVNETLQEWTSRDIGDAAGGLAIQRSSDGLYTGQVQVIGGGSNIWGVADGFQFYYQTLVGNGTVTGRLTSIPTGSGVSPWAKIGVMMRSDLTPGSMNALVGLDVTGGQRFFVRLASNTASTSSGTNSILNVPYWFKLTRVNNTFTGYSSADGQTWNLIGVPATIPMNNRIYVGMAVTSHNQGSLLTAGFDSVGILQQ